MAATAEKPGFCDRLSRLNIEKRNPVSDCCLPSARSAIASHRVGGQRAIAIYSCAVVKAYW
ncbi:MAG: hypothetical protein GDA48_20415 [Hormoscilla sp. GM102CHS1]|nr:hypothetical protein [Hormoscilla sp. SP12CHS1]MBC6474869.1 hypothetical protein [Hormoscilla sp. GM102CHS1]